MNATIESDLTVDFATESTYAKLPKKAEFVRWAKQAFELANGSQRAPTRAELSVQIVDETTMSDLNQTYRSKSGSTNVLSFAADWEFDIVFAQDEIEPAPVLLGDVVICAAVVEREALSQNKPLTAHYAHMVTHGVLHLCGFDHETESEAQTMEALEIKALAALGFSNPYA